jgi:phosphate transport system substrate-binding protein
MFKRISIVLTGMLALVIAASGYAGSRVLKGTVKVDGSSTVFPITEAVAEEFGMLKEHRKIRVTVGVSGTGGGFKKFLAGETDINDASRPIKQSEIDKARKNGVQYIELPVAYDGLSVVINKKNTWVDYLTVAELHKIWKRGSTVKTWKDIRPNWPDQKIRLYGPGTDSGTFDYFTEVINGKSQASRSEFTKSEDDNVLVNGVAGDKGSLGYFGFAYYVENKDKLKVVPIRQGNKKPVAPTITTINNGSYAPLSRPIFIYVNLQSAKRPEVREFIRFYLKHATELVTEVGYVPLPDQDYQKYLNQFENDFLKLAKR